MKKIAVNFTYFITLLTMPALLQADGQSFSSGSYFDQMVSQIKKPAQVTSDVEVQSKVPTTNFFGYAQKIKKRIATKEKEVVIHYNTGQPAGSFVDPSSFFNQDVIITSESE